MLHIDGLSAGYGRSTVLHDITLSASGVTAILGHNGAGKSTLLRAAIGLLKPKHGMVRLNDTDITKLAPHQRVKLGMAYVPQGQQCFPHLTTWENLRLIGDETAIANALKLFPALTEVLKRRAGLLSGGQRQQLAIARALLTQPKLLLLDEPTEGIQPSIVAEIETAILALAQQEGLAVLLVEQHLGFALRAAQHYYVLESGRITSSGAGGAAAMAAVRQALTV
jgi:urea transport system ATP-binding protein